MPWEEMLRSRGGRETPLPAAGAERRKTGSLIRQVAESIGQTVDREETETPAETEPLLLPDGYLRRSPVQPYHTAADYRSKRIRKAVTAAVVLCLVVLLVLALLRGGLLKFK